MPAEQNPGRSPGDQELLAQLRQSLGLLRVAFDSTDEVMVIADHNMRIRWANQKAADCFGAGITALLVGRTVDQCIQCQPWIEQGQPSDDNSPAQKPLRELILEQSEGEQKLRIGRKNRQIDEGAFFPGRLTWRQITSMSDAFHLIIIRDLDPIEQSLDRQRSFIQSLAHELRTPLALLTGNLKRLDRLLETSSRAQAKLESAQQETDRVTRLVDKLMLLSDLETGRYPWNWEVLPFQKALKDWQQSLSTKKQTHLHIRVNSQNALIRIDRQAFHLVLDQLFENSLQFSDGQATVLVEAEVTKDAIKLLYQDSGPGLQDTDQDQIATIFNRFQRLEQHRKAHRAEGGGLGLALAKELMEGMGGTLQLASPPHQSERPCQGTQFSIGFQKQMSRHQVEPDDQGCSPVT